MVKGEIYTVNKEIKQEVGMAGPQATLPLDDLTNTLVLGILKEIAELQDRPLEVVSRMMGIDKASIDGLRQLPNTAKFEIVFKSPDEDMKDA